jgi:catechol 2,3-dioxygenase-like lactoylglutathione lyase family enzyme
MLHLIAPSSMREVAPTSIHSSSQKRMRSSSKAEPQPPRYIIFVQQRVGLHHLCLRARSREDVDRCAALLEEIGATIVRGPQEGNWAPGYYYVLFEDPDGIRLEVNFVPGAGLLAEDAQFDPKSGYV